MLLNRSWGARGHPFAQHYSCPAFLDAQLVLQVAAVGIFFRMWSIASIAQGQALRSIGKAATSVLPPLTTLSFSSKMNMPLTQVALVARPCAPAAQRAEDSSSSRSRLAKSYGRLAPLSLKQACFFRVYLPKATFLVQSACGGQLDSFHSSIHREAPFRQLPKVADASQPL